MGQASNALRWKTCQFSLAAPRPLKCHLPQRIRQDFPALINVPGHRMNIPAVLLHSLPNSKVVDAMGCRGLIRVNLDRPAHHEIFRGAEHKSFLQVPIQIPFKGLLLRVEFIELPDAV